MLCTVAILGDAVGWLSERSEVVVDVHQYMPLGAAVKHVPPLSKGAGEKDGKMQQDCQQQGLAMKAVNWFPEKMHAHVALGTIRIPSKKCSAAW